MKYFHLQLVSKIRGVTKMLLRGILVRNTMVPLVGYQYETAIASSSYGISICYGPLARYQYERVMDSLVEYQYNKYVKEYKVWEMNKDSLHIIHQKIIKKKTLT